MKDIVTSCHYNDFDRMCASIGFQKLVDTYWPSFWLRPWSLCGDVCWSWISNASRTFLSNFLSSVFKSFVSVQQNPTLQVLAWSEMPVLSHFSSVNGIYTWRRPGQARSKYCMFKKVWMSMRRKLIIIKFHLYENVIEKLMYHFILKK